MSRFPNHSDQHHGGAAEYEVFLSFRGEDTRHDFTDHLYMKLVDAGIRVFRDDEELRVGEIIGPELLKAIKASKISIPVISPSYASSKWCLQELVQILECRKMGQVVLPIFYRVNPSDVRNQTGDFGNSFDLCKKKHGFDGKVVQEWKGALVEVTSLKGWESGKIANGHEGELVKMVVKKVFDILRKGLLAVPDHLVGVKDHAEEIMKIVGKPSNAVQVIGIHGMGGIGKTTLAKVIYNQLSDRFECRSFLANIRETSKQKGLECLQKQVIVDILKHKLSWKISNTDEGIAIIKERFKGKKVLILLDDVNSTNQLDALAGKHDWFGPGSILIITTRSKDVLKASKVTFTYKLDRLDFNQSFLLFRKHAFRSDNSYLGELETIAKDIVSTTGGLPLAIEIIGSFLHDKHKDLWEDTLKKLKRIPNDKVQQILKMSYDELKYEEKQIFLDIACLSIQDEKEFAVYMWDDCDFYPREGIEVLMSLSLIKIGDDNRLIMHDQLRDLGRDIVRQENYNDLGNRSRLWIEEEALEVMQQKQGTKNVQALNLICEKSSKENNFTNEQFQLLTNLRFLQMEYANLDGDFKNLLLNLRWLRWKGCSSDFMATNFCPRKLVVLDVSSSTITKQWKGWHHVKLANKLKVLKLEGCNQVTATPDMSAFRELKALIIVGCESLRKVHPSICTLNETLSILHIRNCKKLEALPAEVGEMEELREFIIDGTNVREIPISEGYMTKLETLSANFCSKLQHVPLSIGSLVNLQNLSLRECNLLEKIPDEVSHLTSLEILNLEKCLRLKSLPDLYSSLMDLRFSGDSMETLPNISKCTNLRSLQYTDNFHRRNRVLNIGKLNKLVDLRILNSNEKEEIRDSYKQSDDLLPKLPSSLERLHIIKCQALRTLPPLSTLKYLSHIELEGCTELKEINDLEGAESLSSLEVIGCRKLTKLSSISDSVIYCRLDSCNALKSLPDLSSTKNLKELVIQRCENLVDIQGVNNIECLVSLDIYSCSSLETIGDLSWLKMLRKLDLQKSEKLNDIKGIDKLTSLEKLIIVECSSLERIGDLSHLKTLKKLELQNSEKLIFEGIDKLTSLEKLIIDGCASLERVGDLSRLKMLRKLELQYCKRLSNIIGVDKLTLLERLIIVGCPSLKRIGDLSCLKRLEQLELQDSEKLSIEGIDKLSSLEILIVDGCSSLERIGDLSRLKVLSKLELQNLEKLSDIKGIDRLTSLEKLIIVGCSSIERIGDLSRLKKLRKLELQNSEKLYVEGIDRLTSMEKLIIDGCSSLERLGDLSHLKLMKRLELQNTEKLRDVAGIDKLTSLEKLIIIGCSSLERIGNLSRLKKLRKLELQKSKRLTLEGIDKLTSLEKLIIDGCSSLERIGDLSHLKLLKKLELQNCGKLSVEGIEKLTSLEILIIDGCPSIKNIGNLSHSKLLRQLELQNSLKQ